MNKSLVLAATICGVLGSGTCQASDNGRAYGGRVSLETDDTCPPGKSPLLIALLPTLIKEGLAFVTELMNARAQGYSANVSATTADMFMVNCGNSAKRSDVVRIKKLHFGYGPVSGAAPPGLDKKYLALGFTDTPNVYLDADVVSASGTRYARLKPTLFEFNNTLSQSGKTKDLVLTVSFDFPSAYVKPDQDTKPAVTEKPAAADAAGSASHDKSSAPKASTTGPSPVAPATHTGQSLVLPAFERLTAKTTVNVTNVSSGWVLLPEEDPSLVVDNGNPTLPVTINVVAAETDTGHGADLWLSLSKAISDNATAISTAITGGSTDKPAAPAAPASGGAVPPKVPKQ